MTDLLVVVRAQGGAVADLAGGPPTERLVERIGDVGEAIEGVVSGLRAKLQSLAATDATEWPLDEIAIAFSVELQAEAGVVLAKASSSAGIQATVTWKRAPQ